MALETLIQGRIISIPTLDEDVKLQVSYSTHALVSCLASCVWRAYLLVRRRSWRSTKPTAQYINTENANRRRFGSAARNSRAELLYGERRSETERDCIYACRSRAHRGSSVHIFLFHRKVIPRSFHSYCRCKERLERQRKEETDMDYLRSHELQTKALWDQYSVPSLSFPILSLEPLRGVLSVRRRPSDFVLRFE